MSWFICYSPCLKSRVFDIHLLKLNFSAKIDVSVDKFTFPISEFCMYAFETFVAVKCCICHSSCIYLLIYNLASLRILQRGCTKKNVFMTLIVNIHSCQNNACYLFPSKLNQMLNYIPGDRTGWDTNYWRLCYDTSSSYKGPPPFSLLKNLADNA